MPHNTTFTARKTLKNFANGGNVLILATVLALIIANLPWTSELYTEMWTHKIALQIGNFNLFNHNGHTMNIIDFINDALMAVFFFTIGLEIKREILVGELSSFRQALLPIAAGVGGMICPVIIFFLLAKGTDYSSGAAIPMATDIAFSLGVLAMLGNRVPISIKIFLTTLAVVDDIGGILVIAIFYSSDINLWMIASAACLLGILALGGKLQIQTKIFYLCIGGVIWFLFLNAGIHPTIAGVLIAFCVPAKPIYAPLKYVRIIRSNISYFAQNNDSLLNRKTILDKQQINRLKEIESASDKVISPLQDLEDSLHPMVNYMIIPLFAFANAGILLGDMDISQIFHGVSLAIMLSLILGKFIGIFSFSWILVKLKMAPMPEEANWKMMAAVASLGGIGFTVSLFIADLSFGSLALMPLLNQSKIGILTGSLIAGLIGWALLHFTLPKHPRHPVESE